LATFTGVGNTTPSTGTFYIAPASTTATASDYYFTSFTAPTLTSASAVTVPNAFTVYIAGPPAQAGSTTITNPYALLVASGRSYFAGQVLLADGSASAPAIGFVSDSGLDTGFYRIGEGNIGITADGVKRIDISTTTTSWTTGHTVNIGTTGTTSPLNVYGTVSVLKNLSVTCTTGGSITASTSPFYVAPGSTTVSGSNNYYFTHYAIPATTGSTTGAAYTVYIDGAPSGTITNPYALYVAAGATRLVTLNTTGTITSGGLLTASTGLTVSNNTVTFNGVGSSTTSTGTFYIAPQSTTVTASTNYYFSYMTRPTLTSASAFTVPVAATLYVQNAPLAAGSTTITDTYAIYVESGNAYFGGSVVMNSGFSIANGQTMNIGTSGTSSTLNVYGVINVNSISTFTGVGNASNLASTVVINPASTTVSGTNNYYFTSLLQPTTSGSTTGSAYTLYIAGAPTGTITNPYAFYIASGAAVVQSLTTVGLLTANAGITSITGQTVNVGTSGTTSPLNVFGLITGSNGLTISSGSTSLQATTTNGLLTAALGINVSNGQTLNVGTSGNTSPLNVYGLITGLSGLTISSGSTSLQAATTNGLLTAALGLTVTTGQTANIGTTGTTSPLNVFGLITGSNGLTISSGSTSLQATTTNGLLTAALGINVTTGQTANIGTTGTTSPLNVFGLITGSNGLTISSGSTSLQATTTNGLLTAALGLTVTTGQTANIGTSGTTSPLNVYGLITGSNGLTLSAGSVTIGQNGTYTFGSIYSDANWGMLFRARQSSPTIAEFSFANSADTKLLTIISSGNIGVGTITPLTKLSTLYSGTNDTSTTPYYNFGLEVRNTTATGANNRPNMVLFTDGNSTQGAIGAYRENHSSSYLGGLLFLIGSQPGGYTQATPSTITEASNSLTEAMRITPTGIVQIAASIASTSTTGALYLTNGGLTIAGTTNATSLTSGGGITCLAGASFSQDVRVGADGYIGVGNPIDGERRIYIANLSTGTSAVAALRFQNNSGLGDGLIFFNGTNRTTDGGVDTLTIRNNAGSLRLQTNGSGGSTIILNSSGITTLSNSTASTSGSTGALVLSSGGLAIGNTTNATSSTNGGGFTCLGGAGIAQDLRIGGWYYMKNTIIASGGDDIFLNANSNTIYIRPTTNTTNNQVYNSLTAFAVADSTGTDFATFTHSTGNVAFTGKGNTTSATSSFYIAPASTTATASNYFFTTYATPTLTSASAVTVPNAYTVYIADAPAQAGSTTITNSYALYVASGASLFQAVTISGTFTPAAGITIPNGQTLNVGTSGTTSPANIYGLITGSNGLTISSGSTSLQAATTNGLLTAALGLTVTTGQTTNIGTSGTTSPLNVFGLITGSNGLTISSGSTSLQATTTNGLLTVAAGLTSSNGQTVNVGTSGITSTLNVFGASNINSTATFTGVGNTTGAAATVQVLPATTTATASSYFFTNLAQPTLTNASATTVPNAYTLYIENAPAQAGSVTITNPYAIYVASGRTRLSTLTTAGLITADAGITVTTGQTANIGTTGTTSPLNVFGLITGSNGLTISSGSTSLQAATTNGLLTAALGLTVTTGQTANIGTSGTTSPLNVFGLITGSNGLTISSGTSSLQAVTAAGLITANAGITSANGFTVNVGTSGNSSVLNVYGTSTYTNTATYNGFGGPTFSTATIYVNPFTTTSTAADQYFTYFASPTLTSVGAVTVPNAYTVYIAGPPAQAGSTTITNPYALVVASGRAYFGGQILAADGSASAPGYSFVSDSGLDTGLYRIAEGNIGLTINSTKRIDFAASTTSWTTGHTVNIGTAGTTSPLNVFGLITGSNGLTISSGSTSLQATTTNGLLTAALGLTVTTGQTANIGTSGTTSPLNVFGLITGNNGLTISSGSTSLQATTTNGLLTAALGINVTTGQTVNIGSTGTTSPLNVYGLITGSNGLTISSGLTTLPTDLAFSADSIIRRNTTDGSDNGYLIMTGGGGDLSTRGGRIVLSGNERVTYGGKVEIAAGTTASIEFYTNGDTSRGTINSSGVWTISASIASTSSSTGALVLTNGGLAIGNATNSSSSTNGGAFTCVGGGAFGGDLRLGTFLYVKNTVWTSNGNDIFLNANSDAIYLRPINGVSNSQIYNNTTAFGVYDTNAIEFATFTHSTGTVTFSGKGNTAVTTGTFNIAPASTTSTATDYYFTTYSTPTLTSASAVTVPNAYTVYIADAPAQAGSTTITNPYALYVASGRSLFQTVTTSGLITASAGLTVTTGQTLNVGTSGTTSPLNVYGLITGSNGLTISSGSTSLQATTINGLLTASAGLTVTTGQTLNVGTSGTTSPLNVYGLITGSNGLTLSAGGVIIGQGGTYTNGSIYSDANWGMLFRSRQSSPTLGEFAFANTSDTKLMTIFSSGAVVIPTSISSTSSSTGVLVLSAGGLAIGSTTNATSYTNGGGITNAGGFATALDAYFGSQLFVGTGNNLNGERGVYIDNTNTGTSALSILRLRNSTGSDAVIFLNGANRTTDGGASTLTIRNDGGSVRLQTNGSGGSTIILNSSGITTLSNATASTSSSTGALVLTAGGLAIGNTTDSTDYTNGGAFSCGGGGSFAKSLRIGGWFYVLNGSWTTNGNDVFINANSDTIYLRPTGGGANQAFNSPTAFGIADSTGTNFALFTHSNGNVAFSGKGNTLTSTACLYVAPASTTSTAADYYFSTFGTPTLTSVSSVTVPNAYTVYIAGAPAQAGSTTITNSVALYVGSGNTHLAGGLRKGYTTTSSTSISLSTATHTIVECTSSSTVTVTLPSVTNIAGQEFVVIRSGTGTVNINTTSSQTIDDGTTTSVSLSNQYDRVTFICGSTQWYTM
jgi:hypothetical protein